MLSVSRSHVLLVQAVSVSLLLLCLTNVAAGQTPVTAGYRDFSYGTTGLATPTGEKPESKLWFNDGVWWADMFHDDAVTSAQANHIFRFDPATQSWIDTGTVLDDRNTSKADVLWDNATQKLYVASHIYSATGTTTIDSAKVGRLYRYSYDPATKTYTKDVGFPAVINQAITESLVLAKDSGGTLWATWVENSTVMISHTTGDDTSWVPGYVLPTPNPHVNIDDISSVIAFGGNVGVIYSNQVTTKIYFAVHAVGTADTAWTEETGLPLGIGTETADDHINVKTDDSGRIFAAIKTSQIGALSPVIELLVRSTTGTWSKYVAGTGADDHTRPIVLLDTTNNQVYIFATAPEAGGAIYFKKSSMTNISFPTGLGTPSISSTSDVTINNATSTKQNIDSAMGILVLASDSNTHFYLHSNLSVPGSKNPIVSSFTPVFGPAGTSVSVSGSRFTGTTGVKFNGVDALGFTPVSDSLLSAIVPATTTGKITITNAFGTGTSTTDFTVTGVVPQITSFTPTTAIAGTSVTITGVGFYEASAVAFNGTHAVFTANSDLQISTKVPAGATTGAITVTNPQGTATSSPFTVIVAPTITSFTPTSGSKRAAVTITGTGFTGTTSVLFGASAATFTVTNDGHISTTVPNSAKTGKITVKNAAGTAVSTGTFTVRK